MRVQAKAAEIGDHKPPSYKTVLRVIKPIQEKKDKNIRTPGWQGSKLILSTRDGNQINITHMNQVWQCDHTKVNLMMVDKYVESWGSLEREKQLLVKLMY